MTTVEPKSAPAASARGRFHLILGRPLNLSDIQRESDNGTAPGHVWTSLQRDLDMTVHTPAGLATTSMDRFRARLVSRPEHWALARKVCAQINPGDILFCTGEDVAIPMAAALLRLRINAKLVFCAHNIDRPRARLALKYFRVARAVSYWFTFSQYQAEFIRQFLAVPAAKICWVPERTETRFFTPGPASPGKTRPLIISIGLEQRDYHTLAAACRDLNVDVKVSAFSQDAKASLKNVPEVLPANMSRRFYQWDELRQLYRDADLVVVSLFPCKYCAGITTYLEALACQKPVLMTATQGMREYVDPPKACRVIPPGNPVRMRQAIEEMLAHPDESQALADQGYEMVQTSHTPQAWLQLVEEKLRSL